MASMMTIQSPSVKVWKDAVKVVTLILKMECGDEAKVAGLNVLLKAGNNNISVSNCRFTNRAKRS